MSHENVVLFRSQYVNFNFMNHLKIKRKISKNYVDHVNVSKKYVAIKDFQKARKIFKSIIRKIIYDKLQKKQLKKK